MDLLGDDGLLDLRKRGRATDPEEVVRELREETSGSAGGRPDADTGWGTLRPEEAGTAEPGAAGAEASGTCPLCKLRPGRLTCRSCARRVCKADAWIMFSLCRTCAKEDRVRNWNKGPAPEGQNWLEGAESEAGGT